MRTGRVIGIAFWLVVAIMTLLTWISSLEFNREVVRISFSFIATCGLPLVLLLSTRDRMKRRNNLIVLFAFVGVTTIVLRVGSIFRSVAGYATQELMYVHKNDNQRRIEFQVEDVGAFGFNRRTVEITPCCFLFSWIEMVNENEIDESQWIYIGEYTNELGLKGG